MSNNQEPLRSILVTGSGSGIGAAIARRLAAPGTGIVIHAQRNRDGCERVAAAVRERGADAVVALGDLGDPSTAGQLVATAVQSFGGLGVLVANAGFPIPGHFDQVSRDDLDQCYRVMTGGFFELATRALPYLRRARDGRVIAISTLNAHVFRTGFPVYPASASAKAGLEALVRSLAMTLATHRVTVNAVAPGLITKDADTPQFYTDGELARLLAEVPLARMGEPDEVAAMVAFLAGADASYITAQVIHVNGGIV